MIVDLFRNVQPGAFKTYKTGEKRRKRGGFDGFVGTPSYVFQNIEVFMTERDWLHWTHETEGAEDLLGEEVSRENHRDAKSVQRPEPAAAPPSPEGLRLLEAFVQRLEAGGIKVTGLELFDPSRSALEAPVAPAIPDALPAPSGKRRKERWPGEFANPHSLCLTLASRFASFSDDWTIQRAHVNLAIACIRSLGEMRVSAILKGPVAGHQTLREFLYTDQAKRALASVPSTTTARKLRRNEPGSIERALEVPD